MSIEYLDEKGKIVTDGKIFGKKNLYDRFLKYIEKKYNLIHNIELELHMGIMNNKLVNSKNISLIKLVKRMYSSRKLVRD